jgi:hypothetical protein
VNPTLIPDSLLTISYPDAICSLILSTPVNILQANSYKNLIHRGPNVSLPKEIELDLSVGMCYMFRSPRNSQLIKEAWNDFVERLRWHLYFTFDQTDSIKSYDPDYEVPHTCKGKPPHLPQYLEHGILMGQNFVYNTISHIPKEEECNETRLPLFVPLAHLLLGTCLVLHKQDFLHHYRIYSNTIWSSSGYL